MSPGQIALITAAGMGAGAINTLVGSGTLITFPVLLACGYAPVTANVSNTIGLVPGSVSGAYGYRAELAGQRHRALRFGAMSLCGGLTGAILLLVLPASAFAAIVPVFIAAALILTLLQPRIQRRLALHERPQAELVGLGTFAAVYATGVYGGYFGAAQGIMLLAVLGTVLAQDLHRTNALKNVLAGLTNAVAGVFFVFAAHVDLAPAALIAAGSIAGAQLAARYGRRLPVRILRGLIVVVGVVAIAELLAS